MKLFAPKYYKDFVCIADRCKHSCCVGWEIDIDEKTAKKYAALKNGYGKAIKESVEFEETPHFKLCETDRCPHLAESGLCNIILSLGESYLCDICREHPRFYNYTVRGKEVGLGMSCEEAARIILNSDDYSETIEIVDVEGDPEYLDFDAIAERNTIYAILKNNSLNYSDKLRAIYEKYGITPSIRTDAEWREILASLEYLDKGHKDLFSAYSSAIGVENGLDEPLSRALAYFIYRHTSEAEDIEDFRISLGFCLLLERLLSSVASVGIEEAARIISEEIEYSEDNTDTLKFSFSKN